MTIAIDTHPALALAHARKAVEHYEKLIAGDGITCADLVVFGAELAKALRQRAAAERAIETIPALVGGTQR